MSSNNNRAGALASPWSVILVPAVSVFAWGWFGWMRSHRESFWAPPDLYEFAASMGILLLASAAAGLVLAALAWPMRRLARAAAPLLSLLVCTAALSVFGGTMGALSGDGKAAVLILAAIPASVALAALVFRWLPTRGRAEQPVLHALWVLALAAGMGGASLAGRVYYVEDERARMVALAGSGVLLIAGALSTLAFLLGRGMVRGCTAVLLMAAAVSGLVYDALQARPRTVHPPRETKPNVLLLVIDTLALKHCSAFGGPVPTPNLERLAQRSARFEQVYSLAPCTMPAMVGMLTSRYPIGPAGQPAQDMAAMQRWFSLPGKTPLGEVFRDAGYHGSAIIGNAILAQKNGPSRGFDDQFVVDYTLSGPRTPLRQFAFAEDALHAAAPSLAQERWIDTTRLLTEHAVRRLRQADEQPFFMWLHYMDPHGPYDPPYRLRERSGPWPYFAPAVDAWPADELAKFDENQRDFVRHLYLAEIAYVDAAVGRVLDALDRTGLRENTLVLLTVDHGEEVWERNGVGHGHTIFNELVHVPWMFSGPGVAPRSIPDMLSTLHTAPTLAELAGVAPLDVWQGISLADVVRGKSDVVPHRPIFINGTQHYVGDSLGHEAAVVPPYKIWRVYGQPPAGIYHMLEDPEEQNNLLHSRPELADQLLPELDAISGMVDVMRREEAEAYPVELDDEIQQRLETMGYL